MNERERMSESQFHNIVETSKIKLISITYLSVRFSVRSLSICLFFSCSLCNFCLICHTVHDSSQLQESWLLSCLLSFPFFSTLHKQSRLTLVPSFFLERSGVQVSICGNDAREVPADWLIAKKPRDLLRKFALEAINAAGRATKNLFAFALAFCLNGSSTSD